MKGANKQMITTHNAMELMKHIYTSEPRSAWLFVGLSNDAMRLVTDEINTLTFHRVYISLLCHVETLPLLFVYTFKQ